MSQIIKSMQLIPLSDLHIGDMNVRKETDHKSEEWKEFVESLKRPGLIEPVLVLRKPGGKGEGKGKEEYQVIAGSQRVEALKQIHGTKEVMIPCAVTVDLLPQDEVFLSIIENTHRTDLTPGDYQKAIQHLKQMGMNNKQIAKAIHRSEATVSMMKEGKAWSEHKKSTAQRMYEPKSESGKCPHCNKEFVRATGFKHQVVGQVNYMKREEYEELRGRQ